MLTIDRVAIRMLALLAVGFCLGCGSSTPANGSPDGASDLASNTGGGGSSAGGVGSSGSGGHAGSGQAGESGQAGAGGDMTGEGDAGTPTTCKVSKDCGKGSVCDTTTGSCVDCLANADCPAKTPACSSGHTCGAMCNKGTDCSKGLVCEVASHSCVECLVAADCGAGGVCQSDLTCR